MGEPFDIGDILTEEESGDWYRRLLDIKERAKRNVDLERSLQDIRDRTIEQEKILGKSFELGEYMDWDRWAQRIPCIKFKSDWSVRIIPPSRGVMVRFLVRRGEVGEVSVFLDCHTFLGYFVNGDIEPYWEVYPFEVKGIERVAMDDVQGLLDAISKSLDYMAKNLGI
jgi:hypothetical protein